MCVSGVLTAINQISMTCAEWESVNVINSTYIHETGTSKRERTRKHVNICIYIYCFIEHTLELLLIN